MALRIKQRRLDELKPYEKNARVHTDEQIKQIARSIEVFGMNVPILIDSEGVVLAGHGRLEGLKRLGHTTAPTIELAHLSDEQKRAFIIADNKIGDNSHYDDGLLFLELKEIHDSLDLDIDLDLVGFTLDEFLDLEVDDRTHSGGSSGTSAQESSVPSALMNECWKQWAGELREQHRALMEHTDFSAMGVTKGFARSEFLRALYDGTDYPRYCSHAYHKHQIEVAGDLFSPLEGLEHTHSGKFKTERLRFSMAEKMSAQRFVVGGLPFAGARGAPDFPACLARDLINEFATDGSVLDPCHGWGGRLIGFLLSDAKHYDGIDCAEQVVDGVRNIYDDFRSYVADDKTAEMHCSTFEDWQATGSDYDFALTSPPYFDVEKYIGGDQSHTKFKSYAAWRNGFFSELIEKTHSLLRSGGVFALQVGSQQYPLLNDGCAIAESIGFAVEAIRGSGIVNNFHDTSKISGETILILRK